MSNKTICLSDLLDEYLSVLRANNYSKKTLFNSKDKISKFIMWFEKHYVNLTDNGVESIKPSHIRTYIAWLYEPHEDRWGTVTHKSAQLQPYSVWSYCSPVRAWFNWLLQENYIDVTPFTAKIKIVSKRDTTNLKIKTLEQDDIALLFKTLKKPERKNTFVGSRNLAICAVLLDTGIRLGELISMRTDTLDFTHNRFEVSGKTGVRVVVLSPTAKGCVEDYLRLHRLKANCDKDSKALWLSSDGYELGISSIQSMFVRLSKELNITVSPHRFRHNFVSSLANNNVNAMLVQQLAGHSQIRTTMSYYHPDNDALTSTQNSYSPLMQLDINGVRSRRGRPKAKSK